MKMYYFNLNLWKGHGFRKVENYCSQLVPLQIKFIDGKWAKENVPETNQNMNVR